MKQILEKTAWNVIKKKTKMHSYVCTITIVQIVEKNWTFKFKKELVYKNKNACLTLIKAKKRNRHNFKY